MMEEIQLERAGAVSQQEATFVTQCGPSEVVELKQAAVAVAGPELTVTLEQANGVKSTGQIIQVASDEVRVRTRSALKPGEVILFSIRDHAGHLIWESAAEAHWARAGAVSSEVGLFFYQRITEELIAWTRWDRRNQLRYPVRIASRIWWDAMVDSVPVMLVNYSSNGIGILTPQPGHVGRNFLLSTCENAGEIIVVQGSCCWQVSHDRGFMIGCELPPQQGRRFSGHEYFEDQEIMDE